MGCHPNDPLTKTNSSQELIMAKANDKAVNEISVRTLKVARKHRPYYAPVGSPHNLPYRHYPDVPGLRLTGYTCATSSRGAMEQVKAAQSYDMGRHPPFYDIGYHYAISCSGELLEARDIRFVGSHVWGDNTGKLGIVLLENLAEAGEAWQQEYRQKSLWGKLIGSLDIARDAVAVRHELPTQRQIDALSVLIGALMEFFNIKALGGHREYQRLAPGNEGRACPGKHGMQVVADMRAKFQLKGPSK
jgi:hypothetical protein